jgi:hypothetical protein
MGSDTIFTNTGTLMICVLLQDKMIRLLMNEKDNAYGCLGNNNLVKPPPIRIDSFTFATAGIIIRNPL